MKFFIFYPKENISRDLRDFSDLRDLCNFKFVICVTYMIFVISLRLWLWINTIFFIKLKYLLSLAKNWLTPQYLLQRSPFSKFDVFTNKKIFNKNFEKSLGRGRDWRLRTGTFVGYYVWYIMMIKSEIAIFAPERFF